MPINPTKYYNPINRLSYKKVPIKELQVSGNMNSERLITGGYELVGSVSSRNVCRAYEIIITYDGPVDIGERNIISKRIPNPKNDANLVYQAKKDTGIQNGYAWWHGLWTCLSVISCTYCCFINCIGKSVNDRDTILNEKIDELSEDRLSREIAAAMKEADELVTERINYKKSSQPASATGSGNITLSQDQFQALLAGQKPHAQVSESGRSQGITIQFDNKSKPDAANEKAVSSKKMKHKAVA